MRLKLASALGAFALVWTRAAVAVEGGTEDRVTTHAISIATGGPSSPSVRCSGTLISPNVVLTVRHCITPLPVGGTSCDGTTFDAPSGAPSDLWVDATPWVRPSTNWRNVAAWTVPEASERCGNDIALLVLATPFTDAEATPAEPVLRSVDFEKAALERFLGLAAFGATSAAGADTGVRRSRFDVPIKCVPGLAGFACNGALAYLDVREFAGGAGPCSGDSGAGAMVASAHDRVFGVLSRGDLTSGTCSEGIFERTDVWRWLIAKTVVTNPPASPSRVPAWAIDAFPSAPNPGDLCLGEGACHGDAACVSFDGRRSFVCAPHCKSGCPEGSHCESDVCAPGPAPVASDGGCSLPRRGRPDLWSALLLVVVVAVGSRIVAIQRSLARARGR